MSRIQVVTCLILFFTASALVEGNEFAEAIEKGNVKKVEELIKENPKAVNAEIPEKGFPLSIAVSKGKVDIVKLLLDNGADPNSHDPKTKENVVFRLIDAPQTEESLKRAIEIVGLLKEKKADFNVINSNNMTPLYVYSIGRQPLNSLETKLLFLETFIEAGAKMDIKLKRDEPLLNAVLMKVLKSEPDYIDVAKVLIKLGAPVNEKSSKDSDCKDRNSVTDNDTPLIIVTKREGFQLKYRTEMIKLLVENGARTTSRNKKGETPKKLLDKRSPMYKANSEALRKTKVIRRSK